ncbi:MAG TPA: R3H domain-containing nucleic acid-binding protein [Nocardioides sp.]|nr:R3H domain-containing nucleic acid-binding protein [Nocardioides sp.]
MTEQTHDETSDVQEAAADSAVPAVEGSQEDAALPREEPQEDAADAAASSDTRSTRVLQLEREGDIAADYLEELLDIADLDGDLDMDVEGDRAAVSIIGADLSQLVGRDGEVLEALQELTRLAVYRETGERSRLMLDISGFRAHRREELADLAAEAVARVRESGERVALAPMSAFERKVVHDVVTASGLVSESEGAEPGRFVVILPG